MRNRCRRGRFRPSFCSSRFALGVGRSRECATVGEDNRSEAKIDDVKDDDAMLISASASTFQATLSGCLCRSGPFRELGEVLATGR